jgi:hypothetical protein
LRKKPQINEKLLNVLLYEDKYSTKIQFLK